MTGYKEEPLLPGKGSAKEEPDPLISLFFSSGWWRLSAAYAVATTCGTLWNQRLSPCGTLWNCLWHFVESTELYPWHFVVLLILYLWHFVELEHVRLWHFVEFLRKMPSDTVFLRCL